MPRRAQAVGRREAKPRDWIMPGTTLAFAVLMAGLAPAYGRWFGANLPPFTRAFLAVYPIWIAIGAVALALAVVGEQIPALAARAAWRRALDAALTVASILIVAAGIIALALPLLVAREPA